MRVDVATLSAVVSAAIALGALVLSGFALAASNRSAAASEASAKTAQQTLAVVTKPRWSVTASASPKGVLRWQLTNTGHDPAYDVEVSATLWASSWTFAGGAKGKWKQVGGGEAFTFDIQPADNFVAGDVRVSWRTTPDDSAPEASWSWPLPLPPPKPEAQAL